MLLRLFIIIFILCQTPLKSHEIKPAVLDLIIENQSISMDLKLNAEIVLADIDASQYQDTNNSPQSNIYDQYRFQSATELKASIVNHWDKFQDKINVNFEGELTFLDLKEILTVEELNLELPRETNLQIELMNFNKPFTIQFDNSLGPVVLRQFNNQEKQEVLYTAYLQPGEISALITNTNQNSVISTIFEYVHLGIIHIIPKGLDHILFILGIFFYSIRFQNLLWQVTMFTLAHSITLILASLGLIIISPAIIEPLIALSICFIAIENIFQKDLKFKQRSSLLRYSIIFIFGLIHGLGFASVLGEIGMNISQLFLSLISFNVGVEIAQIGIILILFGLLYFPSQKAWYRQLIQIPTSLIISIVGLYWFIERVFF